METIEELQEFVGAVTQSNVRGRLIDRGEARAIIRRDGHLPEDAPPLGETLDIDLSEYGFSLLRACLVLRERAGNSSIWRAGFRKAANAFEALVRNGSPQTPQRGFWRVMGGASYHLAGYSAMAYSLIKQQEEDPNFAPSEIAIVRLLLRDLRALRADAQTWLDDPIHHDDVIGAGLAKATIDFDDAVSGILTTTIYRAFSFFEFALATGSARCQAAAECAGRAFPTHRSPCRKPPSREIRRPRDAVPRDYSVRTRRSTSLRRQSLRPGCHSAPNGASWSWACCC